MIPEFAIMGHPNEGKSSVLSTLAEDDSVRISAQPGETVQCRSFPVIIDGRDIITFTDTPGFQNPGRMLAELQNDQDSSTDRLHRFYRQYRFDPDLQHDCELVQPLLRGAGIIYVADGSRPLRNVDLAEMEILRLTGKPRMAILNCKDEAQENLAQWKAEFRKHFNSTRVFNAHRANYRERILLLEALQAIEQDWQEPLAYVVATFKKDWRNRNIRTVEIICEMLAACLNHSLQSTVTSESALQAAKDKLFQRYGDTIRKLEQQHHLRMKKLYKHNIFNYQLPQQSILHQDLFADETWEFLGLKKSQLAIAGGAGGAALAAGVDLAAGGASLGLFTSLGGALGAFGALYGSRNIAAKIKVLGIDPSRTRLQIGPNTNTQFPHILLDRALIYYSHIINWAHGRRDYDITGNLRPTSGYLRQLPTSSLNKINTYFRHLQKESDDIDKYEQDFREIVLNILDSISTSDEYEKDHHH
jgi:hypothetical protein